MNKKKIVYRKKKEPEAPPPEEKASKTFILKRRTPSEKQEEEKPSKRYVVKGRTPPGDEPHVKYRPPIPKAPPPLREEPTGRFARPAAFVAVRPETLIGGVHDRKSATVEITGPEDRTSCVQLPEDEAIIGRDLECAVPLPFANVSRRHARMFRQGEEHVLEDLNSTNGTYVNGVRISRCILHDGDLIQIGKARLHFAYRKVSSRDS